MLGFLVLFCLEGFVDSLIIILQLSLGNEGCNGFADVFFFLAAATRAVQARAQNALQQEWGNFPFAN